MKTSYMFIAALLLAACAKSSSGDTPQGSTSTSTPKTTLQGTLYYPATQNAKNLRIYLDNNTNPFDGATETLSSTTNNQISQTYSFDTLSSSGTFYLSVWVDVDGNGSLSSGDYFGWYRGGSNEPASANYTVTANTTNDANIGLSTYASPTGTTATVTVNLPSASTGENLAVFLDYDQDGANGWVGLTLVRTDGSSTYVVPLKNIPAANYHLNVFKFNNETFSKSAGFMVATRNGTAMNPVPPLTTTNAYTTSGNTAVTITNSVFRTSSSHSITGTLTLGAAQPSKSCIVMIDQDNNLGNGFTDGVKFACGSSTAVNFTLSFVPAGNFYLVTHVDNNDGTVNSGDYFGYHSSGSTSAPGATTISVAGANVTGANFTPTSIP